VLTQLFVGLLSALPAVLGGSLLILIAISRPSPDHEARVARLAIGLAGVGCVASGVEIGLRRMLPSLHQSAEKTDHDR